MKSVHNITGVVPEKLISDLEWFNSLFSNFNNNQLLFVKLQLDLSMISRYVNVRKKYFEELTNYGRANQIGLG